MLIAVRRLVSFPAGMNPRRRHQPNKKIALGREAKRKDIREVRYLAKDKIGHMASRREAVGREM
jgi:hypothetical protein